MKFKWVKKIGFLIVLFAFFMNACTQDDDGSLNITSSNVVYSGKGFFLKAQLDSGYLIHLAGDTLFMNLDSIWSFDNCGLKEISVTMKREDTVLSLFPEIKYQSSLEDCSSPLFRPDTIVKILFDKYSLIGIGQINVYNDKDSLMDTILVRRGLLELDTFSIYVDSLFDSVKILPIRTKGMPSLLKVLDSLTPRVFYWRPMKSTCAYLMDNCSKTISDTVFPNHWLEGDTVLVPIRQSCKDSSLVYCKTNGWENDSLSLGNVQKHLDTLWHTSFYYVEKIPYCGSLNYFSNSAIGSSREMQIIRDLYKPSEDETFCGPSTQKEWYLYDINRRYAVPDSVNTDSLIQIFEKAKTVSNKKTSGKK